jgi:murein DD-endopeptidase MepM/ murein hydrolase activator NlpD
MGAALLLATQVITGTAHGDIYRHDGDDGVVSFTDAPQDSRYALYLRERRQRQLPNGSEHRSIRSPASPGRIVDSDASASRELPLQGVVTSAVGIRHDPFDGRLRHHNGLDIAAPTGTPVKPVADGTVIFSGWRNGYGYTVIVDHGDGLSTVYAHHSINRVTEGETVSRDSILALSGSTGRSTGPHLHFEAWQDGTNVTASYLPAGQAQQTTIASAPVRRILQSDGTLFFTNLR